MKLSINKILNGDALTHLKELPKESIDCIMTSPPYWMLRDYEIEGQIGLEKTFDEYINKLCDIFEEVKRVMKKSGTCWVNLGDTYGEGGTSKGLTLIPFRFSIEMVKRGWILRNTIIWNKRNCMPSSVKDRFTVDFEYLFFFTKNKKYYFETQYEKVVAHSDSWYRNKLRQNKNYKLKKPYQHNFPIPKYPDKKNKRAVWSIPAGQFSEAHFAVYPEELCETPIKAGCPEFVCGDCGEPLEKFINPLVLDSVSNTNGKDNMQTMWKGNLQVGRPQESKTILQQEMQSDMDSPTQKEHNIQNKNIKGLHSDISTDSPKGTEIRIHSRTQISNGEKIRKIPEEERNNTPQERDKGRQQDTELSGDDRERSQPSSETEEKNNKLSTLSEKNKGFYKCKKCGSSKIDLGVVLDCFFGAGTTGIVALKQNKKFIGIELNPEYIKIAKKRLKPYLEQRKL